MEKPRFFTRKTQSPEQPAPSHFPFGKIARWFLILLVTLLILGYIGLGLFMFGRNFSSAWKEIEFAYQKPALVRSIRIQYEKKQTALDNEFLSGQQTDQALTDQIKKIVQDQVDQKTKANTYSFK